MDDVKLILSDGDKIYELKSYNELIELIFGEEYKELSFEEKFAIRFEKAFPITIETGTELVDTRVGKINGEANVISENFIFSKAFIIDNEKTFILSLLKFKNMLLLEKKNENIFYIEGIIENLEKSNSIDNNVDNENIKNIDNEYIVINNILDKLLLLNMKLKQ